MKTKHIYTTAEAVAFCKKHSIETGMYVMYVTIFDTVVFRVAKNLPSSKHIANDYPNGYFYKGVHKQWSKARKIAAQNVCNTKD